MNTYFLCCIGLLIMFFQAADAQWKPTNGPCNGYIDFFAVDTGIILAGSQGNGVFRSTDRGLSWTPVDSGLPVFLGSHRVSALAAGDGVCFAGTESGIVRSIDNGKTWTPANSGITQNERAMDLYAILVDSGVVVAGMYGNIFRSIDGGMTWSAAQGGFMFDFMVGWFVANEHSFFAGTSQGVLRSTDKGESWTVVPNLDAFTLTAGGGAVFAGTYGNGVFRSTDNGETCTAVNSGLANKYVCSLFMSGASLFAGTEGGIFRSIDKGETWTAVNSGLWQLHIRSFAASGSALFAGTAGGGIFRSTDNGSNWIPVNSGLRSSDIVRTLSVAGSILIAGIDNQYDGKNVFASSDNGLHWTNMTSDHTGYSEPFIVLLPGGAVFTGTPQGISFSTTGGVSWTHVESDLVGDWENEIYSFTSNSNGLFIGTRTCIIRSIDSGVTWSEPDSSLRECPIYCLLSKSGRIIAGSDGGVFVSSDSIVSWKKIPFGFKSAHVEAFANCGDAIFAASSYNGVFRSDDNGARWRAVNSGLANTSVFSLISHDSTLFAGTFGSGVFMSIDKGTTWRPFNTGIPEMRIYSLAVSGGELFAGTGGYGVWQRPLSEAGVSGGRKSKQAHGSLSFDIEVLSAAHPRLLVAFSLMKPENVSIALFALSGKEILPLLKSRLASGAHRFDFDTRTVARGCYAVKIQAGNTANAKIIHIDN
jgi:photosystem II stability/assembly factor-like uncharacterized protein